MMLKTALKRHKGELVQVGAISSFIYVDICDDKTFEYFENKKIKKTKPFLERKVRGIYNNYAGVVILIEGTEQGKYWTQKEFKQGLKKKDTGIKKTSLIRLPYKGKKYTFKQIAELTNMPVYAVRNRYKRGWTPAEIIETPYIAKKHTKRGSKNE